MTKPNGEGWWWFDGTMKTRGGRGTKERKGIVYVHKDKFFDKYGFSASLFAGKQSLYHCLITSLKGEWTKAVMPWDEPIATQTTYV